MAVLPRTRTWRRRGWRPWAVALGSAVIANAAVVAALAHLAGAPPPPAAPAPLAQVLRRVAPSPAPPRPADPPPVAPAAAPAALPALPVAPAMPVLDLPDIPLPGPALALPTLPALPTAALAVRSAAPVAGPPSASSTGTGSEGADGDRPARRDGAFDLARFYPPAARRRGIGGRSRLRLGIDAEGRVAEATLLASEPAGLFDDAAVRLARSLRYHPGLRAGRPSPCIQTLHIDWTPP